MIYDVLIIGGGVSGMSCGLILGSAQPKPFASDKKIGNKSFVIESIQTKNQVVLVKVFLENGQELAKKIIY